MPVFPPLSGNLPDLFTNSVNFISKTSGPNTSKLCVHKSYLPSLKFTRSFYFSFLIAKIFELMTVIS